MIREGLLKLVSEKEWKADGFSDFRRGLIFGRITNGQRWYND